jgi:hypothetical protein
MLRRLRDPRGGEVDLERIREQAYEAVREGRPIEALELADGAVAQPGIRLLVAV